MGRISVILRDIRRGAGHLPHVGGYPGNPIMLVILAIGGLSGLQGAAAREWPVLAGVLAGVAFMALCMGPLWVSGCVSRARLSDRLEGRSGEWLKGMQGG